MAGDILEINKADDKVRELMTASCYDCHSQSSNYPWYSDYAPVSWFISRNIKEGREHANYQDWNNYGKEAQNYIIESSKEVLENKSMPHPAYLLMHKEAVLSEQDRKLLIDWLNSISAE